MNANEVKNHYGVDLPLTSHVIEIIQNGYGFIIKWKYGIMETECGAAGCCSVCRKKYVYSHQVLPGWDIVDIVCKMCLDKCKSEYRESEFKSAHAKSLSVSHNHAIDVINKQIASKETQLKEIDVQLSEKTAKLNTLNEDLNENEDALSSNIVENENIRRMIEASNVELTRTRDAVQTENAKLLTLQSQSKSILDLIRALPCSDSYPDVLKAELTRLMSLVN